MGELQVMVCLHEQCFSVSDATAASKDRNNPISCAVSDAAVASDTEKHCSCKQTLNICNIEKSGNGFGRDLNC
jgi:hypothetical protein